ncbi:GNAT family N-acetyltransferase [Streptomyces sp. NPDC004610]|uniref:GNAT family N-acetyltransferase n=1 Tax=unclassified Streptomyces TaxID=2593676 RepID=UPI0033BF563F
MTTDTPRERPPGSSGAPVLRVGGPDEDLQRWLDDELTAFNDRAAAVPPPEDFSVALTGPGGERIGGLTGWVWGGLCAVEMLWVREDRRHEGWGSRLMRAAEAEAVRRGCTDLTVSTYTFQAPDFYPALGFRERGRVDGVPGGHQDVYFHKTIGASGAIGTGGAGETGEAGGG